MPSDFAPSVSTRGVHAALPVHEGNDGHDPELRLIERGSSVETCLSRGAEFKSDFSFQFTSGNHKASSNSQAPWMEFK